MSHKRHVKLHTLLRVSNHWRRTMANGRIACNTASPTTQIM